MTPDERAAALLDYEPSADMVTWEVPHDMRARIVAAIRAAEDAMRERCAQVAEGHFGGIGWGIAQMIRVATGTSAAGGE